MQIIYQINVYIVQALVHLALQLHNNVLPALVLSIYINNHVLQIVLKAFSDKIIFALSVLKLVTLV